MDPVNDLSSRRAIKDDSEFSAYANRNYLENDFKRWLYLQRIIPGYIDIKEIFNVKALWPSLSGE